MPAAAVIHDTASRNGTYVNGSRIDRADLRPGDVLMVCREKFLVAWVGPDGEALLAGDEGDTFCVGGSSATG